MFIRKQSWSIGFFYTSFQLQMTTFSFPPPPPSPRYNQRESVGNRDFGWEKAKRSDLQQDKGSNNPVHQASFRMNRDSKSVF